MRSFSAELLCCPLLLLQRPRLASQVSVAMLRKPGPPTALNLGPISVTPAVLYRLWGAASGKPRGASLNSMATIQADPRPQGHLGSGLPPLPTEAYQPQVCLQSGRPPWFNSGKNGFGRLSSGSRRCSATTSSMTTQNSCSTQAGKPCANRPSPT